MKPEIESYRWIAVAFVAGTAIGVPMAMMPMTAVPQRTALSHAFGALAAALVGTAEFYLQAPAIDRFTMGALVLEVLLGFLTFTASLMAFGKLQEILPTRPSPGGARTSSISRSSASRWRRGRTSSPARTRSGCSPFSGASRSCSA